MGKRSAGELAGTINMMLVDVRTAAVDTVDTVQDRNERTSADTRTKSDATLGNVGVEAEESEYFARGGPTDHRS